RAAGESARPPPRGAADRGGWAEGRDSCGQTAERSCPCAPAGGRSSWSDNGTPDHAVTAIRGVKTPGSVVAVLLVILALAGCDPFGLPATRALERGVADMLGSSAGFEFSGQY